jgi:hypothetical protein
VLEQVGIAAEIDLPRAPPGRAHWRDYYTPETRDIVARWYAREIDAFNYSF